MSKLAKMSGAFIRDKLFGKYLLLTNTISGGGMMLAGDYVQQNIEKYRGVSQQYDVNRASNMGILGMVFAPVAHFIYKYMEKYLPRTDRRTVLKKLAIDQTTTAPISIIIFFSGINFLEGKSISSTVEELKSKFVTVYLVDCLIFIPCQAINFFFLPARYRVLYLNSILLVYDTFLSYIKYKDNGEKKQEKIAR